MNSSFQRAHEQYLTPPDDPDDIDCDVCDGHGIIDVEEDGMLVGVPCYKCKGDGSIQQSVAEQQECIDNERADIDREEQSFREQSEGTYL